MSSYLKGEIANLKLNTNFLRIVFAPSHKILFLTLKKEYMNNKIKFGTDGWRAIIADTFTTTNVARVATATAQWVKKQDEQPSVVLGFDCRFGGKLFAEVTAKVLCAHGVKVYFSPQFVSTPMVSLGTQQLNAHAGVVITASHNPPSYNGYKLKASFGGPATPQSIKEVEDLIPETALIPTTSLATYEEEGLLEYVDMEKAYIKAVAAAFDLDQIRRSNIKVAYDAMYGAGQRVIKQLLPDAALLHCDYNPSFKGQAPEPIPKNLGELAQLIKDKAIFDIGIANDGDADRIGVYDGKGNFVDSHHVILLLIYYLKEHKGLSGKVVTAFSVTDKVKKLCEQYGLAQQTTKIGFKYICEFMVQEDVLLGGEESGGIATKGHIPERDGIWMGLLLLEFMAKTGKSLEELIEEVYAKVGAFAYERDDLHLTNELKQSIMDNCKKGVYQSFGDYTVQRVETIDGYKFHLSDTEWLMIRPSGTEPVLRVYAEAPTQAEVRTLLDAVHKSLLTVESTV